MTYTIKNIRSFQGREATGFSCSLYLDGKRIGTVTDTANGGDIDFYLDKGEREKLDKHCLTLPKRQSKRFPEGLQIDAGMFVCGLVSEWDKRQQVKRWCKTQTVYRFEGDKKGSYRIVTAVYDAKVKDYLEERYADKGLEIMNEKV